MNILLKCQIRLFFILLFNFILVNIALAAKESALSLGQVAQNLMEPVDVLSSFVITACFAIGGAFLFTAVIKYFEHRRSPLMVPISTVIFLLIAGILLMLLPFLPLLMGSSK